MKLFLIIGAVNGFLAVALGAFGAHGLEGRISEKAIATWEKAVLYQMFHTMAILAAGILMVKFQQVGTLTAAGWLFLAGIVFFSGSLYLYALTSVKTFAMITPVGGVLFLIGWVMLLVAATKNL